jgi:ubiquinone/menaquinone biosynthesis C-methylase UbiE
MNRGTVQQVFGKRAAFYVNSEAHTDQEVLRRVRDWCGDLSAGAVLDVGTGTGHTALFLAPQARKVIGLDITREMLVLARDAAIEKGIPNTTWVRGDVMALPFPDRSFDAVCSRRAPHHFTDLKGAIGEMVRVLKDGGRLIIDDRSVPEDHEVDVTMNALDRLHDPSHVKEYGMREWRDILQSSGLRVEKAFEYRRHLPLTSLTGNAEKEDAVEIERKVASMPTELRRRMAIEDVDDQTYLDHYFVTLQATK